MCVVLSPCVIINTDSDCYVAVIEEVDYVHVY